MLYEIDLDYNEEILLLQSETVEYLPYQTNLNTGTWFDYAPTWLQARVQNENLISEVKRLTEFIKHKINSKEVKPRFYRQEANTEVPPHCDIGTKCAINIILSDNYGPIQFTGYEPMTYKCALLDTTKEHSVPPYPEERMLLKFSIFDVTFDEAKSFFERSSWKDN